MWCMDTSTLLLRCSYYPFSSLCFLCPHPTTRDSFCFVQSLRVFLLSSSSLFLLFSSLLFSFPLLPPLPLLFFLFFTLTYPSLLPSTPPSLIHPSLLVALIPSSN
ncbi:hypothetical protein K457DRAFT_753351 [Linnemannia elongata AG-77]|uniref:Uncharacterized protein n=1 Tax=Linnemannia elongata AG-77 TaxID=1314771 RepID=A0A197JMC1_9FUNG|nr:hypothetical protein K457DRAFT_753351 [Linnemannia elongata AG-77]